MASQAPTPTSLPLLYNGLEPLQRQVHGDKKFRRVPKLPQLATTHAIPLTVDEFPVAQRFYPIIFSTGESPVPLALMGLHEGTNTFFTAEGEPLERDAYMPGYIRRYPFMLARLHEGSDQLSLCFDPTFDAVGDFEDGFALFDGENPSAETNELLAYCEQFEQAGQRTTAFMTQLAELGLMMEGEVAIQPQGSEQPFIYRGFQMVDEEKFRNLRGDELRKMNQSGMLPLIIAHLFSLGLVRELFGRHIIQGSGPKLDAATQAPAPAEA